METILLKILDVQNEILAELRLLRQALAPEAQPPLAAPAEVPAAQPAPAAPQPPAAAPVSAPADAAAPTPPPAAPEPQPRSGGMLTMDELADLGDEFLDTRPRAKARTTTVDVSDLRGTLLDDIKAKNRSKRAAFAEFDRSRRS